MSHNTYRDASPPNPVESLLGYHIRRASSALLGDLAQRFSEIGITVTEASVLMLIGSHDGITQSEIGRLLNIKRANMAPLAANLTKRGWVERVKADGRSQLLSLTTEGRAVSDEAYRRAEAHDSTLCPELSAREREVLIRHLSSIWR